jgi:hypothetical protein
MYRTYFDPVYSRDYCEIWQESFQKYLLLCPQAFDGNERTPRRIICKENDLYLVIVIIERTELRTYRVYFLSIVLFILRMLNWSNVWYGIIAFYFSVILGRKIIKSRLYIYFFFFFLVTNMYGCLFDNKITMIIPDREKVQSKWSPSIIAHVPLFYFLNRTLNKAPM